MAIELIVDTPVLKGEKGDKGDTGSFDYGHLEEIVDEHLNNRFADVDANLELKVDKEEGKSLVDDEYIQKLDKLDTLDKTVVEKFNDKIEQSDLEENLNIMEGSLQNYIDEKLVTAGSGDMLKSVYDTNDDGVVDLASQADNEDRVNNLTVETAVPENAVFTDTTYEKATAEKDGLMSKEDKVKLSGIQSGANYTEIINNLTSLETKKALSAAQGKTLNDNVTSLIPRITSLEEKSAVKLFEGAVAPNENETVTLKESMNNYKFLVFLLNGDPAGVPFGFGIYPVIDQSQIPKFGGQSILFCDAIPFEDFNTNAITIYAGEFRNESETKIKTIVPIHNVVLRKGMDIGGATKYYIRQVWGIR